MDWTKTIAVEMQTGEREAGDLEALQAKADDNANVYYD